MNAIVSIIIPTFDNPQFLIPCLSSMLGNKHAEGFFHIIVVDNGHTPCESFLPDDIKSKVQIVRTGENLGWEGGLIEGLKHVPKDVEFILFCNDDVHIPTSSFLWLADMVEAMRDPKVGAVGPSSNVVMGAQNIFDERPYFAFYANYLIGFCMLVRKEALEKAGGIDATLPGGDDLDLSIRLIDAGYKLVVHRRVFVYHHGFKTGTRVKGDQQSAGGWNSYEMWHKTNTALIKKHGFARWQQMLMGELPNEQYLFAESKDTEKEVIYDFLDGAKDPIYELGCGATKTVETAIGVDMIPKGERIYSLPNAVSVADIVADVSKELPFSDANVIIARHILEHVLDPIETLVFWKKALQKGGRIVIAVPNELLVRSIPMNREHKHAFTPAFLTALLHVVGFKNIEAKDSRNNVSFVIKGEVL